MTSSGQPDYLHRPRGRVRHYAGMLSTSGMAAVGPAAERKVDVRIERARAALRARRGPGRSSMRALVAAPGRRPSWRMVPEPAPPGPMAAIVHPLAVATCDMDRALMLGATPFPLPLHLGHECVAEVVAVGSDVHAVEPGQRVVVPFQISCGECAPCLIGNTGNCTGVPPLSMYGFGIAGGLWGGAIADQMTVPFADAMLVPLPDHIDPAAAASVADNVVDAYRHIVPHLPALITAGAEPEVLILGALEPRSIFTSSAPLYAGLIALSFGARHVRFVDASPSVQAFASRLEANAPDALRSMPDAPLVILSNGTPGGLRQAMALTAPDGICSCIGTLHASGRIPLLPTYCRNLTLHIGRAHARRLIPEVLELMAAGRLQPERVTTNVASFDNAVGALREHCSSGAIKTILTSE